MGRRGNRLGTSPTLGLRAEGGHPTMPPPTQSSDTTPWTERPGCPSSVIKGHLKTENS